MKKTLTKVGRPRDARRKRAIYLVRRGATLENVATVTGLALSTVSEACKAAGVKLPKRTWKREIDPKWKKVDWSKKDAEIARELNLSHTRIYQMRRFLKK